MTAISDVYIINTADKIEHRKTKHCVCISVSKNKWLIIDTENRGYRNEMEIKSSNYEFLQGINRYVGCLFVYEFDESKVIKKVGNINYTDMTGIVEKLKSIKAKQTLIQLADVIPELEAWLANYQSNKLADVFNKR